MTELALPLEEIDSEDFLEIVWGESRGWVDLPAKVGRYWVPFPFEWPADLIISRRIDTCLRDREDMYYSVTKFASRGRKIEDILPTDWLWADLDEVLPQVAARVGLMPTLAIQSSPGRYQALWKLESTLRPKSTEKLNRGLTYLLGADKGGWDLTQVLRLPGTRNYKYPDSPMVELLWYKPELVYDARSVWSIVKSEVPEDELTGAVGITLPRRPISRRAKQLLFTGVDEVVSGERSARLWELNCLLAEAGLSFEEIYDLVVKSAWNKWAGQSTGKARLTRDIHKAIAHVAAKLRQAGAAERRSEGARREGVADDGEKALPWIGYNSFLSMALEDPKWMIEGIWTAGSHGIIGGEPKTSKTTLALSLGLSVASGAAFLGSYPVGVQGPVLFVQEENAPAMMQDRLAKLAVFHGVREGTDVPLKLLNNWGFNLGIEEHRDMLEAEVQNTRPVLVILDPLYLMFGNSDENRSHELRPFLQWIIRLRFEYNTAVAIVHHMGKQKAGGSSGGYTRAGQRLLGSTTLHGFSDSALYTSKVNDHRQGWTAVRIEPEFRSMEPKPGLTMAWHFNAPGVHGMDLELSGDDRERRIRDLVIEHGDGVLVSTLAEDLGIDRRTILAHIRGGTLGMSVKGGKKGRGYSWKVYLNGGGDG